jgi:hypothetical protein
VRGAGSLLSINALFISLKDGKHYKRKEDELLFPASEMFKTLLPKI